MNKPIIALALLLATLALLGISLWSGPHTTITVALDLLGLAISATAAIVLSSLLIHRRARSHATVLSEALETYCRLEASQQELRTLHQAIEQSPATVLITDPQGVILYVNPKFVDLTGYSQQEVLGKKTNILNAHRQPREHYRTLWKTIRAGEVWRGEFCNRKKCGDIYWEHATISPVRNNDNQIINFVAVKEDITQVRQQRAALASMARFAEHNPAPVLRFDRMGTLLLANGAARRELHIPHDHSITIHSLPRLYDPTIWQQALSATQELQQEVRGDKRTFLLTYLADPSEQVINLYGADISELKVMQRKLTDARQIAEGASQSKTDFLATMSHEIRTPMNAILGMQHLLQRTELTTQQHDYLDKANKASRILLGIIDNILDFSKIEAGRMALASVPFHLDEIFDKLAASSAPQAHRKGLCLLYSLDLSLPPTLLGDAVRLEQVLLNLLSNAIKFTPQGEIEIGARIYKRGPNDCTLSFWVRDTGIGINEQEQAALFHPFSQADTSSTRSFGGTGLGLSISKQLITLMNGSIWVSSKPGAGSTFSFTADLKLPPQQSEPPTDLGTPLPAAIIYHAHPQIRQILVEYLNRHLKTVLAAHDVDSFERHWSNSTHHHSVLLWVQSDSTDATTAHIIHSHHSQPHALTTLVRIEAMGYPRTMPLPPILVNAPLLTTPFTPRSVLHLLQNLDSLQPSDHPAQLLSPAPAPIARGSKILIAEDDEINRVLMRELLRTQGYSVELALNGQEALDRLSSELDAFALVILDLHMPVLDGLQAARAISALPGSAALPLIAMSAETLEETRQMIDSIGFSEILSKPVDPQQLFELLRRRVAAPASLLPPLPQLPFPTLSGIDTTAGLNHAGHNRPLYARLLLTFIKANQQTASALASQEINPSVRGRIHTLKGASGSIGAKQLHALAEKLLDQLDHHNGAGYRASLAQLADALSEIIASITAARPALEDLCAKAPDPSAAVQGSPTHAAVALLRQQLEEFDTGALESFSRLRPQLDWLSLETVEMIQQALERYDFETASSLLAT